jgi:S1-C subfamily serine protease
MFARKTLIALILSIAAFSAVASLVQEVPPALKPAESVHVDIYKKFAPAVVGLTCSPKAKAPPMMGPQGYYGTGAVISADGLVLTDITVIPVDAKERDMEIKVFFVDGKVLAAEIKAIDAKSEGVLLKMDAKNLPYMKLADTKSIEAGDPAYSWGNPHFSIQRDGVVSLSIGAVSGLYDVSSVDDQSRYMGPAIETDAAVNPGSDGGPLTDADGNLLGIMTLAFSRSRWLGICVPTSRLIEGLPDLKSLPLAPRCKPSKVWATRLAIKEASAKAEQATVGIWVAHEGDSVHPPVDRKSESLTALPAIPENDIRVKMEADHPDCCMVSGFIAEADGTVVTSARHFYGKTTEIFVYLPDGSRVQAKLSGKDDYFDVAVLKFDQPAGAKFKAIEWDTTKTLTQGAEVAVLGRSESPGRLTLNSGSINGIGRFENTCRQISALIDYGNLGGPVIDLNGKVAGMAVHLTNKTDWRQNCGVGFMLDAETIGKILPDLKQGKKTDHPKRPVIGIIPDLGALDVKGARLTMVMPKSPAAEAGLKPGDIITTFDGKPIADALSLVQAIRAKKADDVVPISAKRGEAELKLEIKIGSHE